MDLFFQKLIDSVVEIIIFAIIPFIWWLATARKKSNFFDWLGIKKIKTENTKNLLIWTVCVMILFMAASLPVLRFTAASESATLVFKGIGVEAIPAILVYGIFNTSFPEEFFFRGFLLKRFTARFGFKIGNTIQSILFGLLHGVLFFSTVNIGLALLIVAFTGIIAWCMGYVDERKACGSILPSWLIHAASNIFSGICAAFLLV